MKAHVIHNPKGSKKAHSDKFLQKASKSFEEKGTKGAFKKQAKRAGMSTEAYAEKALSPKSKATKLTKKRANFAINAMKANPNKKKGK